MKDIKILNNIKFRKILYQVILGVAVLLLLFFLINNAASSLERQGITSGFGFLNQVTGFDMAFSLIPYDSSSTYLRLFVSALLNTLLISFISIIFATIIGFSIGIMRLSEHPVVSGIATAYVEIMRNLPLLLQVFIWYFAVLQPLPAPRESIQFLQSLFLNNRGLHIPAPVLSGYYQIFLIILSVAVVFVFYRFRKANLIRVNQGKEQTPIWWVMNGVIFLSMIIAGYIFSNVGLSWEIPKLQGFNFEGGFVLSPEFFALFLALSTYTGAYIAENVRSGIQSIGKGQIEAGLSVGLSRFQIMRFIVIPNAMRVIIPPLTNQYLNLTKNSSLAAAIAYPDLVLVFAGTALNQTGQAVEILLMVMLVYLFISLLISLFMNWYNKKMKIVER